MNCKIVLGLALVLSGVWFCCSTNAGQNESTAGNDLHWGGAVGGFQMAAWLDETNGIVHCRIRNATTNEMDYPSFDFGYFENIRLEIRGATNKSNPWMMVFPRSVGYSSACPYFLKRIQPGLVVTDTFTRERFHPWPVLKREEYLKWSPGDTNQALLAESLNRRLAEREALLTRSCGADTFALDLIWDKALADLPEGQTVEARVSQTFRPSRDTTATFYSPVFTLKGSLLRTYVQQNRELWGK